jgi:hypothetical protein
MTTREDHLIAGTTPSAADRGRLRTFLATQGWRVALVASGALLVAGGRMHPSSEAKDPLRVELATMTGDDRWVPGHALIAASAVLLAAALWMARGRRDWPLGLRRALLGAAVAVSLYVVETFAHLGAVVDADAFAAGESAPVSSAHVGLSVLLYPVTGWAIALLAAAMGRAWGGLRWAVAGLGVAAGLLHAFSVPLTILFPDTELSPVFAGAAILLALWSVATGVVGAPRPDRTTSA